ncbi:hypothetical protein Ac2012v2_008143 [Leucoagaricus gongylophorus]
MVSTSEIDDIYSPFRLQVMIHDEIPSSSEDGSGLHSPAGSVFPWMPQIPSLHDGHESFRYQHDPQVDMSPTPELPVPQLYFAQCLNKNQPQQIPIVDSALEPPSSSARQVTFSHCNQLYSSRYHLGHFPTQYPPVSSRIHATSRDTTFRFIPPSYEQSLSGGSSYEPISSNGTNTDGDHRLNPMGIAGRGEPSISNVVNPSRENRKRTRPECNNCLRRNNECEYDAMPKRRGPDKRPGTRQRRCKKRAPDDPTPPNPKRRRTVPSPASGAQEMLLSPLSGDPLDLIRLKGCLHGLMPLETDYGVRPRSEDEKREEGCCVNDSNLEYMLSR